MLLENLTLYNYGVYSGTGKFELAVTPERPIVLVGGFNGAGKTTILESMMVALYGRAFIGSKSKKEYGKFILSRIHRSAGKRADSASVRLGFRFYHAGSVDRYEINREWIVEGMSVSESFSVSKNGETLDDVDETQWQSFIEGLIPLGIAKLFFFDGEKIVNVTEGAGRYNGEIKRSLETLMGADLVRQLQSDLDLHMLRSGGKRDALPVEYEDLRGERDRMESEIESLEAEREKKVSEMDELSDTIRTKESSISGIGGGYADIRSRLLGQREALQEKIKIQKRHIQERLSDDVPFHLVPSMLGTIAAQIQKDAGAISAKALESAMQKKMDNSKFWPDGTDKKALTERVVNMIQDIGAENKTAFDLSPGDADHIMRVAARMSDGHALLSVEIGAYSDTLLQIEKIETEIAKIPRDDEIGPRIAEINRMHEEIGMLRGEIDHIERQTASKKANIKIIRNKIRKLLDEMHGGERTATGMRLALKMRTVLDTYLLALKEKKIRELESNLLHTVQTLLHKNAIHRISIDRDSFEIQVYGNDDERIAGDLLSMGERQIVGTALLWAIAMTCGRSLPFVIDTPLGRLDGRHLLNLTGKFYPHASHQMILLSTDREIGRREYDEMSEFVSRSYRIICDQDRSVTSISEGYFAEETVAPA